MIEFGDVIKASVLSVLALFVYATIANFLVRWKFVDPSIGAMLGRITMALFLPSLLIDEVSRNANEHTISAMWVVPVFDAVCLFVGVAIAWIFIRATRRSAHIQRTIVSLVSTTNVTAIPLQVIAKFLCSTCSLASLKASNLATTLMGVGSLSSNIWRLLLFNESSESNEHKKTNSRHLHLGFSVYVSGIREEKSRRTCHN